MQDQPLQTFSIGFQSRNGREGDEFYYADMVARRFGTQHEVFSCSDAELAACLPDCVSAMSEPMPSHDNIGFYLLSKHVASSVTVALSGQGADELFAGYRWFQSAAVSAHGIEESTRQIAAKVTDRGYDNYAALIQTCHLTRAMVDPMIADMCAANGSCRPFDNLLNYESTIALANGPLCRVDSMTMAASLEARVPFLDEAMIELSRRMPARFKLGNGGKGVLKALGYRLLPVEVVDRPKGYFPVPAMSEPDGAVLDLIRDALGSTAARQRGLFRPDSIGALLDQPTGRTATGASDLWHVGLLEMWLQQQGV